MITSKLLWKHHSSLKFCYIPLSSSTVKNKIKTNISIFFLESIEHISKKKKQSIKASIDDDWDVGDEAVGEAVPLVVVDVVNNESGLSSSGRRSMSALGLW